MREASPQEKARFGEHVRIHPITNLPLEMGRGCGTDNSQAVHVHVPHIRATAGDQAADEMLAKLEAYETEHAKKPASVHKLEAEADKLEDEKKAKLAEIEVAKVEIARLDEAKKAKLDAAKKAQAEFDKPPVPVVVDDDYPPAPPTNPSAPLFGEPFPASPSTEH